MFRESIPGNKNGPLALGVPPAFITCNVSAMKPIPMAYNLATSHINILNKDKEEARQLGPLEIHNKVHAVAREETVPAWTLKEWDQNVFSGYIPCSVLYEDANVLKMLRHDAEGAELYCSMVFTHEGLKEKLSNPADYVDTILAVLHDGGAPPITQLHSERILSVSPFHGVDMHEDFKKRLRTFDPEKANAALEVRHSLCIFWFLKNVLTR